MKQMIQDFLKGLKDGAYGLLLMLLPLAVPQAGSAVHIGLIVAGVVVFVLGVLTNTVQKDFGPLDTWGKVAKDFILGFCTSSIPIIQQGASSGTVWTMILFTCLITGASVFANIISVDVTANTMLAKVFKDFTVLGIGAVMPILTADLTSHQSLAAIMGTIGVALLSVASNVINTDITKIPTVASIPGSVPASAAKLILLLVGFSVLCSPASAGWEVSLPAPKQLTLAKLSLGGPGQLGGILMPTANIAALPGENPSYGFSFAEAFVLGNITPGSAAGQYSISPYIGIGAALYVDFAPWIQSDFDQPVIARGGVEVIGPDMGAGIVEGVEAVYDFKTGARIGLLTGSIAFDSSDVLGIRVF